MWRLVLAECQFGISNDMFLFPSRLRRLQTIHQNFIYLSPEIAWICNMGKPRLIFDMFCELDTTIDQQLEYQRKQCRSTNNQPTKLYLPISSQ